MAIPRIFYFTPDLAEPLGGVRMIYRHVDLLNEAGYKAMVVHRQEGFRARWFKSDTPVTYSPLSMAKTDVAVIPEVEGPGLAELAPGARKVIFNQNAYYTFRNYPQPPPDPPPYLHPEVVATITVSDDSVRYLRHAFPGCRVHRVRYGIDPSMYYPEPKERAFAFMPRKNFVDAQQVLAMLHYRGSLRGWRGYAIQNMGLAEAAEVMRRVAVFLSFGHPEGFGLPPAEAMACGCIVVGYHGNGGREFMRPEWSFPIEVGQIVEYAEAVERVLATFDRDAAAFNAPATQAMRCVAQQFSPQVERASLLLAWKSILGDA